MQDISCEGCGTLDQRSRHREYNASEGIQYYQTLPILLKNGTLASG